MVGGQVWGSKSSLVRRETVGEMSGVLESVIGAAPRGWGTVGLVRDQLWGLAIAH